METDVFSLPFSTTLSAVMCFLSHLEFVSMSQLEALLMHTGRQRCEAKAMCVTQLGT